MSVRTLMAAAWAASVVAGPSAMGQPFPSRNLTLVVPFPAGGPTDTIGRIVAEGLRTELGQSVIVENVPGATGSIGAGRVARADADGHTLILGTIATHVFNGAAYDLKYDVVRDFEPIALVALDPQIVAARNTLPVTKLGDLTGWLKANPGTATAGTAGVGSTAHVSAVRFQQVTGTRFNFVPYRGLGPAMQDLVSGQIDMVFDLAANSVPQVRAGKVKGLAVTSRERLASAPEIPTVDEAGLPGFYFVNWHGIWAPRGTPPATLARLDAAVGAALANPATIKRLGDIGQQIPTRDRQRPQALASYQQEEIKKWWPVIREANIKGN